MITYRVPLSTLSLSILDRAALYTCIELSIFQGKFDSVCGLTVTWHDLTWSALPSPNSDGKRHKVQYFTIKLNMDQSIGSSWGEKHKSQQCSTNLPVWCSVDAAIATPATLQHDMRACRLASFTISNNSCSCQKAQLRLGTPPAHLTNIRSVLVTVTFPARKQQINTSTTTPQAPGVSDFLYTCSHNRPYSQTPTSMARGLRHFHGTFMARGQGSSRSLLLQWGHPRKGTGSPPQHFHGKAVRQQPSLLLRWGHLCKG